MSKRWEYIGRKRIFEWNESWLLDSNFGPKTEILIEIIRSFPQYLRKNSGEFP
jgi:hypothetical protein